MCAFPGTAAQTSSRSGKPVRKKKGTFVALLLSTQTEAVLRHGPLVPRFLVGMCGYSKQRHLNRVVGSACAWWTHSLVQVMRALANALRAASSIWCGKRCTVSSRGSGVRYAMGIMALHVRREKQRRCCRSSVCNRVNIVRLPLRDDHAAVYRCIVHAIRVRALHLERVHGAALALVRAPFYENTHTHSCIGHPKAPASPRTPQILP